MTILELINRTTDYFSKRGLDSPKLQIELLLSHVLQLPRMQLYLQFERILTEPELEQLRPLVKRRAEREPLQHIIGHVQFDTLKLECSAAALIPRPETELFLDLIKKELRQQPAQTLVDVGTGTGALALALAKEFPAWNILALEISPFAQELFVKNRDHHALSRVTLIESNLFESFTIPVQVVVANLPYLTQAEMAQLQPEVRYDPVLALDGGVDGLDLVRRLIATLPPSVEEVYLEIGIAQAATTCNLLAGVGFQVTQTYQDLQQHDRFVFAKRNLTPS